MSGITGIESASQIADLFTASKASFRRGLQMAAPRLAPLAMRVKSTTRTEHYPWLGLAPAMREWLGDRVAKAMSAYEYSITNRKFESTIVIKRDDVDDDLTGMLSGIFEEMGKTAAMQPDKLLAEALVAGTSTPGYDGVPFFSTAHPVEGSSNQSNADLGDSNPRWYMVDLSKSIKPLVYQERRAPEFQTFTSLKDENVFKRDEFVWGTSLRSNVGYGLWQLAYASDGPIVAGFDNADLEANEAEVEAVMVAMTTRQAENGEVLDVSPTHIVCPPILEMRFRRLLGMSTPQYPQGGKTPMSDLGLGLIVSPRLSGANQ